MSGLTEITLRRDLQENQSIIQITKTQKNYNTNHFVIILMIYFYDVFNELENIVL